jgi:solute carrier family 25 carnitine/acylcarnitine transporter 20/29
MLSGVAQVLAEHPLDTLKTRLQTLSRPELHGRDGVLPVLRATVQHEGAAALFLGVIPRLLSYGAVKASLFGLYESARAHELSSALAGALAGLCNTALSCPPELVKSQLQMVSAHANLGPSAFASASARIVARHGARGLYVGLMPLAVRDAIGYAAYFTTYEQRHRQPHVPIALIGGMAGCSFYLAALPADRLRVVMMTQPLDAPPRFRTAALAARHILAHEGFGGFYRGLGASLVRTFVGQAVALTVYTRAREALST